MKHLLLLLTLFVVATPVAAQKTKINYDKTTDFSKFKTYSWTRGVPANNPAINQIIIDSVEQNLASKGLTKTDNGGDLLVSVAVAIEYDVQVSHSVRGNTGSALETGIPVAAAQPWEVRKGSLLLAMEDPVAKSLVWHGTATDTLRYEPTVDMQKDAKRMEKPVKKAVEKLLKQFPPKK
jgi:Domain of unknown function (DUF4136)